MKLHDVAVALAFVMSVFPANGLSAQEHQEHQQLVRGKAVYVQFCSQCHGVDGKRGEGYQTPIWGEGSLLAAKFGNVQNLIEYMQIMPFNDPRLIDDAQRLDVTAFVLANHGTLSKDAGLNPQGAEKISIK